MSLFAPEVFMDDLLPALLDDDPAPLVADWMSQHIIDGQAVYQLITTIGELINRIYPMGLTKNVELGADDFWAMSPLPGVISDDGGASAQMVVASLNGEWDTLDGLIMGALEHEFRHVVRICSTLLAMLRHGFLALPKSGGIGEGFDA